MKPFSQNHPEFPHAERDERDARLAAALASANNDLEIYRNFVCHDLRTPLAGVMGFCHLISDTCSHGLDERTRQYIDRIQVEAVRMETLIARMTDLINLSHGEVVRKRVDLSSIARTVAAELMLGNLDRTVDFSISEGLVVEGDEKMMRIVMGNLLDNAWKFTQQKEQSLIAVGRERIKEEDVFFVRDNGIGFDMSRKDRLFQPFRRLHTNADFPGDGVGLAAVQRILQRHQGRIWAESSPDIETIFYFTL